MTVAEWAAPALRFMSFGCVLHNLHVLAGADLDHSGLHHHDKVHIGRYIGSTGLDGYSAGDI